MIRPGFRYLITAIIAFSILSGVYHINTAKSAAPRPRYMVMRLEDIGPGGQYASVEGLGKLRAVLEFLASRNIPYSLAVIPRWIDFPANGSRYDRSLNETDEPYIQAFDKVLQQAVDSGASLGMHGYTHQAGNVRREDGQHESGIGNEFFVPGLEETATTAFAEARIKEGTRVLREAGFVPRFWEAPHYRSTPEQDRVFRSYFGILYQADLTTPPVPVEAEYVNKINNGYGAPTLGSVYVPTPFSYIPYNKDENLVLDQLGKTKGVPSFFFHPFLEFKHLIPVTDKMGNPVLRDGIPEYAYPAENVSMLQKLTAQLTAMGYSFYSVHDYVPFQPAHRVEVERGKSLNLKIGDVTGDGQGDLVNWNRDNGNITVVRGKFTGLRNEAQPAPEIWANAAYRRGAAYALKEAADGRAGLWTVSPDGELDGYSSDGASFHPEQTWKLAPHRWLNLVELGQSGGDKVLAGLSEDQSELYGIYLHNGTVKDIPAYKFRSAAGKELQVRDIPGGQCLFFGSKNVSSGLQIDFDPVRQQWSPRNAKINIPAEPGVLRFGDFNGDGKEDVLRWDEEKRTGRVYTQTKANEYKRLPAFGSWGDKGGSLVTADFDGNGKKDIGLLNGNGGYMDVALSFQSVQR